MHQRPEEDRVSCHLNHRPRQGLLHCSLPEAQEGTDAHKRHATAAATERTLEHAKRLSLLVLPLHTGWPDNAQASLRASGYGPPVAEEVQILCCSLEASNRACAGEDADFQGSLGEVIRGFEDSAGCRQGRVDTTQCVAAVVGGGGVIPCAEVGSQSARMLGKELVVGTMELRSG